MFDLMIKRLFFLITNVLSVIILLYILSSLDGYICCTLNEFALLHQATFVFYFILLQRKKLLKTSLKTQAANRNWNRQDRLSEQMK